MGVTRRIFIRDGVATVTLGLVAPTFLSAIAQAQGLRSREPRGGLSRRRERRAEYAGLLSGRGVLQPSSDRCRACWPGVAGRHRRRRARAPAASAARRSSTTSSTRGGWPSCSAPGTRTRAGLTSRPPTSTVPPTRSRRAARAGWAAISTRCRGRWTRWPRGIPRKRPRVRSCPHRPVSRRFPTRLPIPTRVQTAARRLCKNGRPLRPWRSTRRPVGRT